MIKRVKKKEETINKLRIYNFFWKPATDPEMGERIEKMGKPINKLRFWNFFLNRKRTQKKRKRTQKKTGNESNVNIAKTDPKYSEIPQHFLVFEGFPIILEKRRRRTQTHFWARFRVEAFPWHQLSSRLSNDVWNFSFYSYMVT